ncbi:antibiotic biosynthesis monooxygenase family protein [Tabrizicola sp.]|uniref:antibiotic biosynthesis monooxygenase family protein n=1 Tax=Tabrizicola sp. TaxID=2005166 RepID=UPI003F3573D7
MILRTWHGAVPASSGDAFERHFRNEVLTELRDRPGNLGTFFRRQAQDEHEHFFLLSYWDSWESIHAFAGERPHVAVTYPEDRQFGLISDPIVLHHQCSDAHPWFGEASSKAI